MSVYKPKGKRLYKYDFQIRGIRFRGGTRCTTEAAAKKVEQKIREEVAVWAAAGAAPPKKPMTANEAFSRYYREKAEGKPSAKDTDRQLAKLLAFFGQDAPLTELADSDRIAEYIARRRGERKWQDRRIGHNGGPTLCEELVSEGTVNREVELLRRVLRRARDVWKRETGPLPDWPALLLEEPEERKRELSAEEEADFFKHLRADYHPLCRFALMTGLRLAPLITLTWKQIDWTAGLIRVRLKSKKPGGREHILPMTPAMRAFLQRLQGQHAIFVFTYVCARAGAGSKHPGRVVRRQKGERYPFSKNGWRRPFQAALEAAGIDDFRFHDHRHTAATRIVRKTGNLKIAQKMLGHATIASTARYAHVTTEDLAAAMAQLHDATPAVAEVKKEAEND